MIELSVALPLYNSGKIAWLALEGLCRQQDINFEWELVVCEEQNEQMLGYYELIKYTNRLKEVGCIKINYISLNEWLSLGEKWKKIANNCDPNSKCFILQAADCFSFPLRLKNTYEAIIKNDFDFYKNNKGYFYNIKTKKYIKFDNSGNIQKPGLNMAYKTKDIINKIPDEFRRAIVDGWLYKHIQPEKIFIDNNLNWIYGLDTHGYNQISIKREKFFNKPSFPFIEIQSDIKHLIPNDIFDRLNNLEN